MKKVAELIEKMDNDVIEEVLKGGFILPAGDTGSSEVELNPEDIEVVTDEIPGYEVAVKGSLTVALDITITDDLRHEGNARELVNRLQNIRRDKGFELMDRVMVRLGENELQPSFVLFKDYICREILADTLEFVPAPQEGLDIEVNDIQLKVNVFKKED